MAKSYASANCARPLAGIKFTRKQIHDCSNVNRPGHPIVFEISCDLQSDEFPQFDWRNPMMCGAQRRMGRDLSRFELTDLRSRVGVSFADGFCTDLIRVNVVSCWVGNLPHVWPVWSPSWPAANSIDRWTSTIPPPFAHR